MSYDRYYIEERAGGQWDLSGQITTSGPPVVVPLGTYRTAAEALDVAGVPLDTANTGGPGVVAELVRLGSGRTSLAYNPLAPFDWESLPPQPVGIVFPEVSRQEVIRVFRGDFSGLKIGSSLQDKGGTTDSGGVNVIYSGSAETVTNARRANKVLAAYRNPQKALAFAGYEGSLLPYQPMGVGLLDDYEYVSAGSITITEVDGTVHEQQYGAADSSVTVGFYRGTNDKTCRMSLVIAGGGDLWAYAPVTIAAGGTTFHDLYGIPLPPDHPPDGVETTTITPVTGDGPTVLGVVTQLYGWTTEITRNGGEYGTGSHKLTWSLGVEEL